MEALIVVFAWSAALMTAAATYCGWCEYIEDKEGQALAQSYIQHLQAARRIAIKSASAGSVDWLQSQRLFAAASQLQDLISDTQQDYVEVVRKPEGDEHSA
ncbi:MAG: hypothetical protein E7572_09650 [Ruminococcaceae bacterium]|nr:hypothetical protein [Oscillospiraceae bacterium]